MWAEDCFSGATSLVLLRFEAGALFSTELPEDSPISGITDAPHSTQLFYVGSRNLEVQVIRLQPTEPFSWLAYVF